MASAYDKASLVMLPHATKEGKLYSVKPDDRSGDFTFSRGTDTATRVNASGLIEKERSNQVLQSNTFSTTWTPASVTSVTGGQSGYDGSSDAWLLTEDTSTSQHYIYSNYSSFSAVRTCSVYVKTNGRNLQLRTDGIGTNKGWANFNLSTGAVGNSGGANLVASKIESISGGWYRCSITLNYSGNYGFGIVAIDNATSSTEFPSYVGDGTSGLYIQDAQMESGLVATDYIETTTAAVYEGITDNLPRLDYSGGASCPSLLLEPSRTNVVPHSEYLGSSDWNKNASGTGVVPILTFGEESPEGLNNAYEVTFNTGAGTSSGDESMITEAIGSLAAGDYVLSFWAKVSSGTDKIIARHAGGYLYTSIELTDEWQRFEVKETLASSGTISIDIGLRRGLANEPLNSSVTCQIYGIQLEAGSYPTSYIPTYGTSASRAAESCYKTSISDLIGQAEGTIFGEVQKLSGNQFASWRFSISDNTNDNWIFLSLEDDFDLRVYIRKNGSTNNDSQINNKFVDDGVYKIAIAYANNDVAVYVNGSLVYSSSTASIPNTTQFLISGSGSQTGSSQNKKGKINQALLFKSRLTNAELAALTTI